MKSRILTYVLLSIGFVTFAQSGQRIAYIDMDYILENIPEYIEAQNALDAKVAQWRKRLDKEARHIEKLKSELENERALLTVSLIEEREAEITLKQQELRRLEFLYFGPNGDLFLLRKKFAQPIQDKVFYVIQDIAKRKRYDFVLDKSSDLIMLYSNKKHDISELVLKSINRNEKIKSRKKGKNTKKTVEPRELSDKEKQAIAKKENIAKKRKADKEAQQKAIVEKRLAKRRAVEEKRRLLREKKAALKNKQQQKKDNN